MPIAKTKPVFPHLAARIAAQGLTNTQVGGMVGVGGQFIGQVIRGHAKASDAVRARLAEVLGQPEAVLFAPPSE